MKKVFSPQAVYRGVLSKADYRKLIIEGRYLF